MNSKFSPQLILAANSIGLAADIPNRSLEAVRNSDLLLFEDPKGARKILKAAGIHRDFIKYSEHEESFAKEEAEKTLQQGKTVLYMSDQGMPNLADPGHALLALAEQYGAKITIIPGPSSITAALAACPFYETRFYYYGFLHREDEQRIKELKKIANYDCPVVILDTPYRLQKLLESMGKVLGSKRKIFLAFDISGENEDYIYQSISDHQQESDQHKKQNFVLII